MKATPSVRSIVYVSTCGVGGMYSVIKALTASALSVHWPIQIICTHNEVSFTQKLLLAARAYCQCLGLLVSRKVSLFHIHVAERGSLFRKSLVVIMARLFHVPVIFHMHGAEFDDFYAACPAWVKAYIRWILDGCNRIVALSAHWQTYYRGLTQTPVISVPNFVDSPQAGRDRRPSAAGVLKVLYLGRFGERKGIYDLINALEPLYERYPGLSVLCRGDGDIAAVRKCVADRGMAERFHILGWIDPPERDRLMMDADVYVLPSHAEGMPMAILEAMAASLCIVATRVGGIPEMIEDGVSGMLVEPHDIEGLRAVFERLLNDPSLLNQLGAGARATYLEKFSPAAVIPRFDSLYRELTGAG